MAFLESSIFPLEHAYGSVGGPERRTDVIVLGSGYEERNARWKHARHSYGLTSGRQLWEKIDSLIAFWHEANGKLYGFRFKDCTDFKSAATVTATDQLVGIGDGSEAEYYLFKKYGTGSTAWHRYIEKPVSGTVLVAVGGAAQTEGVDYSLNYTAGLITFTGGNIPAASQNVTAGFEFHVPVRFDVDQLEISEEHVKSGHLEVPLVEIRPLTIPAVPAGV